MTATAAATAPLVLLDTDPDTLGAARLVIDAQRAELASLRDELRSAQEQLAQFEEVGAQPHIETSWVEKTYTVERTFVVRHGPFKEFHEAVRVRAEIMARTSVQPLADTVLRKGE